MALGWPLGGKVLMHSGTCATGRTFPSRARSNESDMTNFPARDAQQPGYDYSGSFPTTAPLWIIGCAIVLLFVGILMASNTTVDRSPLNQSIEQTNPPGGPATSPKAPSPTPQARP